MQYFSSAQHAGKPPSTFQVLSAVSTVTVPGQFTFYSLNDGFLLYYIYCSWFLFCLCASPHVSMSQCLVCAILKVSCFLFYCDSPCPAFSVLSFASLRPYVYFIYCWFICSSSRSSSSAFLQAFIMFYIFLMFFSLAFPSPPSLLLCSISV